MNGEGKIDAAGCLQDAFFQHDCRTAMAFFAGLEHEHHFADQSVPPSNEQMCGLDEHGDVGVMSARMHSSLNGALEIENSVLVHWKSIHVCPKKHGWTWSTRIKDCGHARKRCSHRDLEVEWLEGLDNGLLGSWQFEAEFWMCVKVSSECDCIVEQFGGIGEQSRKGVHVLMVGRRANSR